MLELVFTISVKNYLQVLRYHNFSVIKKTVVVLADISNDFSNFDIVFSGGGLITFSRFFKFKPSFLVDYSFQETKKLTQLDISGNFILDDLIWLGGSWRTTEECSSRDIAGSVKSSVNVRIFV